MLTGEEAPAGSQGIRRGAAADLDSFLSLLLPSATGAVFPLAVALGCARLSCPWPGHSLQAARLPPHPAALSQVFLTHQLSSLL